MIKVLYLSLGVVTLPVYDVQSYVETVKVSKDTGNKSNDTLKEMHLIFNAIRKGWFYQLQYLFGYSNMLNSVIKHLKCYHKSPYGNLNYLLGFKKN